MTWKLPPLEILEPPTGERRAPDTRASVVHEALTRAGVGVESVVACVGPQVVQYEVLTAPGVDPKKVERAVDAVSLAVEQPARYAGINGGRVVIEVNRETADVVNLRGTIGSAEALIRLGIPMGINSSGAPLVVRLAEMPHLLVAGTTGSGKSAFLTSALVALLLRNTPDDLRLTLVDPKRVELSAFEGLPHLDQMVTEAVHVGVVLRRLVAMMEARYDAFKAAGVRKIEEYNDLAGVDHLPRHVLVVDELADLMLQDRKAGIVQDLLVRLLSLGRAAGIHAILATQRPSAAVLTPLITANVPARVTFAVQNHYDSKIALGYTGAEKLRGQGDGLFKAPTVGDPIRFQAPLVSAADVMNVVSRWRMQAAATPAPAPQAVEEPVDDGAELRAEAEAWRARQVNEATSSLSPQEILSDAGLTPLVVDALVQTLAERLAPAVESALRSSLSDPNKGGE